MGWEHAHQLFHDAVWTQQGLPAVWTSSPQAIVKRCAQRVCQAGNAEWLLATILLDTTVGTSWHGAAKAALARSILGESVHDFPHGTRLRVRRVVVGLLKVSGMFVRLLTQPRGACATPEMFWRGTCSAPVARPAR